MTDKIKAEALAKCYGSLLKAYERRRLRLQAALNDAEPDVRASDPAGEKDETRARTLFSTLDCSMNLGG